MTKRVHKVKPVKEWYRVEIVTDNPKEVIDRVCDLQNPASIDTVTVFKIDIESFYRSLGSNPL